MLCVVSSHVTGGHTAEWCLLVALVFARGRWVGSSPHGPTQQKLLPSHVILPDTWLIGVCCIETGLRLV